MAQIHNIVIRLIVKRLSLAGKSIEKREKRKIPWRDDAENLNIIFCRREKKKPRKLSIKKASALEVAFLIKFTRSIRRPKIVNEKMRSRISLYQPTIQKEVGREKRARTREINEVSALRSRISQLYFAGPPGI